MNKKILAGLIISGVVTSVAFASTSDCPNQSKQHMMYKKNMQHGKMSCKNAKFRDKMSHGMSYKGKKHRDYFVKMFKRLNLSKKQRFEISILRDEMKLELKKLIGFNRKGRITAYINNDGFDAAAYKKDKSTMSTKMIAIRADYMAKMFNVLTKDQIAQLKKNLAN